jgi:gamma-glutamylcyclotransferase (GGCT)/AIG2-like uncharacterized protein YtfP
MLYFAYGSNMNWQQMKQRCPSAAFIGVARLPDYKLAFTRMSNRRGCGVADIVSSAGSEVWGVIYRIDDIDLGNLDFSEGYVPGRQNNAYRRVELRVYADGDRDKPMTVWTYEVINKLEGPRPDENYKRLLIEGARGWKLPHDYVEKMESLEVQP